MKRTKEDDNIFSSDSSGERTYWCGMPWLQASGGILYKSSKHQVKIEYSFWKEWKVMPEKEPSVVTVVGVSQSRFQTNYRNKKVTILNIQISLEAQIWLVALKIVFNFLRFKLVLIWNCFLGDLRRGLNSDTVF